MSYLVDHFRCAARNLGHQIDGVPDRCRRRPRHKGPHRGFWSEWGGQIPRPPADEIARRRRDRA